VSVGKKGKEFQKRIKNSIKKFKNIKEDEDGRRREGRGEEKR